MPSGAIGPQIIPDRQLPARGATRPVDLRADDVDDGGHVAEFGRALHLDLSFDVRCSRRERIPVDRDGSDLPGKLQAAVRVQPAEPERPGVRDQHHPEADHEQQRRRTARP